jgi:two-component system NtrC family sensor kinase
VTELDEQLPLTWADPFQLQQVFLNLLSNAEHALGGWAGKRRITLRSRRVGNRLQAIVEDTGPGIAAEQVDRIFNPFFTTKAVGKGTGLGLSISDGIVREHGGRIEVRTSPNEGAVFTVELPLVAPPGTTAPAAPRGSGEDASRGQRSILVVDDEPAIRTAIARYFGGLGHIVDTVGSGTEALARVDAALAAQRMYDAIVLDVRMADMSGDQLYNQLTERHPTQARRIVFLTGDVQGEETARFLASTDRPSLVKPFALEELGRIVLAG